MKELQQNLNKILQEKTQKLTPENIKKGVTVFDIEGACEPGIDTTDATATSHDIIAGKTAYVNGEKIEGTIIPEYTKTNVSWELKRKAGGTNPAIFGVNDKYLFYYDTNSSSFIVEDIESGKQDSLSSSVYSFTIGEFASIVLGCVRNSDECFGIAVSNGTNKALCVYIKAGKFISSVVQEINTYNKSLMVTPGRTHANLFCSEYRSDPSGGKSINIFTLGDDLSITSSKTEYMVYSDYSLIGAFTGNDDYYVSISGHKTGKTMAFQFIEHLVWNKETLTSINTVSQFISSGFYYCNGNMTHLITSTKKLYAVTPDPASVTITELGDVDYVGTGLFFLDNSFVTYNGNTVYIYELTSNLQLVLTNTVTLSGAVNLQYVNNNNHQGLFEASAYMEYIHSTGDTVLSGLVRQDKKYYYPVGADVSEKDIILGKVAYGENGKIIGAIDKTIADRIIGTSGDTVEDFRRNILNTLCSNLQYQDESGINYTLNPQKYGTGNLGLDKPVSIYFVYDNSEESCYDIISIATGNWGIKTGNSAWYVGASKTEHYVACTSGTDWRNGIVFEHYRMNYSYNFISKERHDKYKTDNWGNKSMNSLFNISSCLYKNLLLVSPNYLNRMISNVSSFAVYKDRAGTLAFPSLNEELNLILSEKTEKIIPENIKEGLTILNVKGTMPNNGTLNYTPSIETQTIPKGYTEGGIISGVDSNIDTNIIAENIKKDVTILGVSGTLTENIQTTTYTSGSYNTCITSIDTIDTSNCNNLSDLFYNYRSLQSIPNINTSNCLNMSRAFGYCDKITTIPNIDTGKVQDMNSMFEGCTSLLSIPQLDTSKVTNMRNMFSVCKSLTTISELNTSSATNMSGMFYNCTSLTSIPELICNNVINISNICYKNTSLTNIGGFINIGQAYTQTTSNYNSYKIDLSNCTSLTHDSLMNVINNLYDLNLTYDVANGGTLYTQSLVLGDTNIAKLTEEEISVATQKGWTIS